MAFRDENGKITIDEAAAYDDVKKLRSSIEALTEALSIISAIQARASDFKGQTAEILNGATASIMIKLKKLIENTDDAINAINTTVSKYQSIDKSIKDQINNTHM